MANGSIPSLPGSYAQLLPEYYSLKAMQADIHRRYLRQQPVPATVIESPKESNAREELEMNSEFLADRGKYFASERIDGPGSAHLSSRDLAAGITRVGENVMKAPANQKKDAQKDFLQQITSGLKYVGRNLFLKDSAFIPDPIEKAAGSVVKSVLDVFAWTEREAAGTMIITAQKFIPGEQFLEKRFREYKEEEQRKRPWWRKHIPIANSYFINPAVRQNGVDQYGVPAGVHIPLGIVFDPLNFVGVGVISKVAKGAKYGVKGLAKLAGAEITESVIDYSSKNIGYYSAKIFAPSVTSGTYPVQVITDPIRGAKAGIEAPVTGAGSVGWHRSISDNIIDIAYHKPGQYDYAMGEGVVYGPLGGGIRYLQKGYPYNREGVYFRRVGNKYVEFDPVTEIDVILDKHLFDEYGDVGYKLKFPHMWSRAGKFIGTKLIPSLGDISKRAGMELKGKITAQVMEEILRPAIDVDEIEEIRIRNFVADMYGDSADPNVVYRYPLGDEDGQMWREIAMGRGQTRHRSDFDEYMGMPDDANAAYKSQFEPDLDPENFEFMPNQKVPPGGDPTVRQRPNDLPENPDGTPNLLAPITDRVLFALSRNDGSVKYGDLELEKAPDEDVWLELAHYNYGLRIDEGHKIPFGPLSRQFLEPDHAGNFPERFWVPMKVGAGQGKANNRVMSREGVEFTRHYLEIHNTFDGQYASLSPQDATGMYTSGPYAGLKPRGSLLKEVQARGSQEADKVDAFFPSPEATEAFFPKRSSARQVAKFRGRAMPTIANEIFKSFAVAYDVRTGTGEGRKLLDFYEKNGNYLYVNRLSFASRHWQQLTAQGNRDVGVISEYMGHSSTAHTIRYIAGTLWIHGSFEDFMRDNGFPKTLLDSWAAGTAPGSIEHPRFTTASYSTASNIPPNIRQMIADRWVDGDLSRLKELTAGTQVAEANIFLNNQRMRFLRETLSEVKRVPGDLPDIAPPEVAELISLLNGLNNFIKASIHMSGEKGLIQLKGFGGTAAEVTEAKNVRSVLEEWIAVARDLAVRDRGRRVDIGSAERVEDVWIPYIETAFDNFITYAYRDAERGLNAKRFAGMGKNGSGLPTLAHLWGGNQTLKSPFIESSEYKPGLVKLIDEDLIEPEFSDDGLLIGFKPKGEGTKSYSLDPGASNYAYANTKIAQAARMTDEELAAENARLIAEGKKPWEFDTLRHFHDEERLIDRPSGRQNDATQYRPERGYVIKLPGSRKIYYVDSFVWDARNNIVGAWIDRLADQHKVYMDVSDEFGEGAAKEVINLRKARDSDRQFIHVYQFKNWVNTLIAPTNPDQFLQAGSSGRQRLSAAQVVAQLIYRGSSVPGYNRAASLDTLDDADRGSTISQIRLSLGNMWKDNRLKNAGGVEVEDRLLQRIPGTNRYKWNKEVLDLYEAETVGREELIGRGVSRDEFGLADPQKLPGTTGEAGKPAETFAPRGSGTGIEKWTGSEDDIHNWGLGPQGDKTHMGWESGEINDIVGRKLTIADFIVLARGLDQPGQGLSTRFFYWDVKGHKFLRGKEVARAAGRGILEHVPGLYWLAESIIPGTKFEKFGRMFIGHTWNPSEYGQLIAKVYSSYIENGMIVSNFEHAMIDILKPLRMSTNPRSGAAYAEGLKGKVKGVIRDTAHKLQGYPVGDHMEHPANKIYRNTLNSLRRGDAKLPDGATVDRVWTNADVERALRDWTYEDNLMDPSVFLGTERQFLDNYYEMTDELWTAYDTYHDAMMNLLIMMRNQGISFERIFGNNFEETLRFNFVPHVTTDKLHEFKKVDIVSTRKKKDIRTFGQRAVQFEDQVYEFTIQNKLLEGASEGRIKHEIYENNPMKALSGSLKAYYDFVTEDRFMDAWVQFGVKKGESNTAVTIGERIREFHTRFYATAEEFFPLVDETLIATPGPLYQWEHLAKKYYGEDWRDLPMEELARRQAEYREMSLGEMNMLGGDVMKDYVVNNDILHNMTFPPNAYKELQAFGKDILNDPNSVVSWLSSAANLMRLMATGADLGVFLLHGFAAAGMMVSPLAILPEQRTKNLPFGIGTALREAHLTTATMPAKARLAWGKGVVMSMRAMFMDNIPGFNSNVRREWYINTALERAEMQKYGVAFFRSSFIEDLPLPGVVSRQYTGLGAQAVRKPREVITNIVQRPIEGFGFFLDVSKTEMWRAYKAAGMDDDVLSEFAASLNAIHGTLDPAIAGIKQHQRVFESAVLMYASLYRRSALALVNNMFSSQRVRRGPALTAASGMAASAASLAYLIKEMGYNDDVFNPGTPDFMAIKIGPVRIGLGTPYYTMMRIGADIANQMMEGDYEGFGTPSFTDNTFLRWMRSQTAPTTSLGIDLLVGKDFVGDPLRDTNGGWEVRKIGDRTAWALAPFWIQTMADSESHYTAGIAEIFGFRTSPVSPFGRLQAAKQIALETSIHREVVDWRMTQYRKGLPVNIEAAPIVLINRMISRSPDLLMLQREAKEHTQRYGTDYRKKQDTFITSIKNSRTEADEALKGVAADFDAGNITGRDFQNKIRIIEAEMRGRNTQLATDFEDVIARFDEQRTKRQENEFDMFYLDLVYDQYRIQVTNNPDLHDAHGNFRVDEYVKLQSHFRKKYGEEAWKYIKERIDSGRMLPGSVRKLQVARDLLSDYWNLHETKWGKKSWQADLVNNYRMQRTQEGKDRYEAKNPIIIQLNKDLGVWQKDLRMQNSAIDVALALYYDYSPLTLAGQAAIAYRQQRALITI